MDGEPIDTPLMDILLSYGAKINQQDNNGNTTLHLMAKNLRQVQAARFLISQGVDVGLTNSNGNTALHECLRMGILLERQMNHGPLRHTFDDQRRALDEMVAILLEVGGDTIMDLSNLAGQTSRQLQSKKLDTSEIGVGCNGETEKVVPRINRIVKPIDPLYAKTWTRCSIYLM